MKKEIKIYLDWQNKDTYIGKGIILKTLENKPIVCFDKKLKTNNKIINECFQPKRCLIEIIESNLYIKGFKKHFIIPFRVNIKSFKNPYDIKLPNINDITNEILIRNNQIFDTYDEIKLRDEYLKSLKIYNNKLPKKLLNDFNKQKEKHKKIRENERNLYL